ncbi:MAG TPA: HD domain-containing protein [Nitrososphaeraceae archaeon]|jgi:putative hydrolase of HD superfamily|nr:HD domain-containing protein [Nitrososphaeraceae archaeon]
MDNYKLHNLIEYILKLKNIKRAGWISKAKILRPESVADHSYSLTALSMVFSDLLGLDTEKVMKMCIIHDLAESIIGDYMPNEISIEEKQIKEDNAMKIILSSFPDKIALLYSNMWKEYCLNQTKEARLVKQLDKVEMFLQANQYLKNGYSYESLSQFLQVLDNIGVAVVEEEENNSKFQSTLENMLKHLR